MEGDGGGRNEELEYYVMTLSRQLNMVLEVLFQPHGNNVVEVVQAKQMRLHSISDVLTENEAILMELAIQHDDPKMFHGKTHSISDVSTPAGSELVVNTAQEPVAKPQEASVDATAQQNPSMNLDISDKTQVTVSPVPTLQNQSQDQTMATASDTPSRVQEPETNIQVPHVEQVSWPVSAVDKQVLTPPAKPQSNKRLKQVVETITPQLEASPLTKKEEVVRSVSNEVDNQQASPADEHEDNGDEESDHVPPFLPPSTHIDTNLHRTKSFFRNCQDLQRQEEARLREQRRREEELMRRMHELLMQSRAHLQQEHSEAWQQQQNDAAQQQQQWIFHLQEQLQRHQQDQQQREQDHHQREQDRHQRDQDRQQLEQEWRREQEQRREADMITTQLELDRKLEALSGIMAAAQATQGHEIAQVVQLVNDFERRFVSPEALEAAGALWLKTAADNCIYGANPETLSTLQHNLQGFQNELKQQTVKAPAITALHEAVDRVVQLLHRSASPSNDSTKEAEQEAPCTRCGSFLQMSTRRIGQR